MTQAAQYGILRSRSDRMFYPRPMEELTSMLKSGAVRRISGFPSAFEEVEPSAKANAPEDLDSVPDEDSKVYETKVMTPEKPAAKRPRTQRFKPPVQPPKSAV